MTDLPETVRSGDGAAAGTEEAYCPACGQSFPADHARCPRDGMRLVRLGGQVDPLIGRVFEQRYEIRSRLGEGGMGAVYRGWQVSVDREVAIKVIDPRLSDNRSVVKRFLREARLSSRLGQPSIVNVYDFGQTEDGILYIVMELVRGHTLGAELHARRALGLHRTITIGVQLCDALDAAHKQGIVHRDLKPGNVILLDEPAGRDLIKVLDFGLAKSLDHDPISNVTRSDALLGTPLYMSPEQIAGRATDARTDLYALGCMLHEMLSGSAPFGAPTIERVLANHIYELAAPLPADVPPALADLIARLIAKHAADRPQTAAEVRDALLAELEQPSGLVARPPPAPLSSPRPGAPPIGDPRRARARWLLGALAVLGVGVAAALVLHRPHAWQAQIRELPVSEENGAAAAFSPDGTMIAYPSDREQPGVPRIYVAPLFGDTPRAVSPAGRSALHPRWTRDGQAILFVDVQDHRAYRVAASGGPVEVVAEPTRSLEDCGSGLVIQYDSSPGCPVCERLALRAPDGTERELVRFKPKERVGVPRCDQAGARVLYSLLDSRSASTQSYGTYDLWLVELAGGAPRRLTTDHADNVGTFAPGGGAVVFSALHSGQRHLWELALAPGAEPRQLTFGAGWESAPDVSPDGKLVIFNIDITSIQLFAQPMSGGAAHKLTGKIQSVEDAEPTPDGRAIVAQVVTPALAAWIVRIPLDGGDPVPLVEGRAPALTLDGREVVYTVAQTGRIQAVPTAGGAAARPITDAPGPVVHLNVGPDGRVHFSVAHGASWEGWSAPLAGGAAEREVPAPWTQLIPAPRGGWRVATRANPYVCRFLPPGAALADPAAREITADHDGAWTADGKSWLFVRDSRVHRYFVETGEDRVVSEPNDYGPVSASSDGETLYTTQTVGRVRRELITNFADRR